MEEKVKAISVNTISYFPVNEKNILLQYYVNCLKCDARFFFPVHGSIFSISMYFPEQFFLILSQCFPGQELRATRSVTNGDEYP